MMNVAGVIKDWLLIYLSHFFYDSPVTTIQLGGYTMAFSGNAKHIGSAIPSRKV